MSSSTFLDLDATSGDIVRRQGLEVSGGATDANKIPITGPDGKLDASFLPSAGAESTETVTASEALAAGDFVSFHAVSGQRRVRRALATDATRPAHGYVTAAVASGAAAAVLTRGINSSVAVAGFVAADVGVPVFLSAATSGGVTKTPPNGTGNIVQRLGTVIEVSTRVRVNLDQSYTVRV